jgi:hypothetical protein
MFVYNLRVLLHEEKEDAMMTLVMPFKLQPSYISPAKEMSNITSSQL